MNQLKSVSALNAWENVMTTDKLYVILCDDIFDQVCTTYADFERERSDLKAMGFKVKLKVAKSWTEAERMEARYR